MLSILIPTHNRTCYRLVSDLGQQLEACGESYEIIVAEDGSRDQVSIIANHKIIDLPHCQHIIRKENVGRAAIRNFLADQAKGEWLLFIDSDARVCSHDFIARYLQHTDNVRTICRGGIKHPDACPPPQQTLRWRYEKDYEQKHGYNSPLFRSFSFLIARDTFMQIRFDENYREYGWEDVLFGQMIRQNGLNDLCFENPLLNDDMETNSLFLQKTETALRTLQLHREELRTSVRLIQIAERIEELHLSWAVKLLFRMGRYYLRRNLLSANPNLRQFSFYKLGFYLCLS